MNEGGLGYKLLILYMETLRNLNKKDLIKYVAIILLALASYGGLVYAGIERQINFETECQTKGGQIQLVPFSSVGGGPLGNAGGYSGYNQKCVLPGK